MEIISNGKKIILNEQQEIALVAIKHFLSQREHLFFCLSGVAGAGKTTIFKDAIRGFESYTCITAPTHKAKMVVENTTGLESQTIHSLIGLKPNLDLENYSPNNMLFDKLGENKLGDYRLVVIDESSMLNSALLKDIKECAAIYKTKILFIGDKMQLAPVGEKFSPVFYDKEIPNVHLSVTERQKYGNPLLGVYFDILSDINSEKNLFKKETIIVDGKGIDFRNDIRDFGGVVLDFFKSQDYKENSDNYKILCHSNDAVIRWNNLIRKEIYKTFSTPDISEGEVLMAYFALFQDQELIIQNSNEYEIVSIRKEKINKFHVFCCTLLDLSKNIYRQVNILERSKDNYKNFIEIQQKLYKEADTAKIARGLKWKNYYDFKNQYLTLDAIYTLDGSINQQYRGQKPLCKKDFDFSYSLTVHKSQGSTYKNVFVDGNNIDLLRTYSTIDKPTHSDVNRLYYVALSRPTDIAFVNC